MVGGFRGGYERPGLQQGHGVGESKWAKREVGLDGGEGVTPEKYSGLQEVRPKDP